MERFGFGWMGIVTGIAVLSGLWMSERVVNAEPDKFQPIVEAPMPAGFPTYTPVGQIEVKRYPAYRMAKADGGGSFWTLFSHIKKNQIAMTAPVQLDYELAADGSAREGSMAFLYGEPEMGQAGRQGPVQVLDVPAFEAVTIGVRGRRTAASVAAAQASLEQWLEEQSIYVADGNLRVMAYNSPFVPRDRQFFEVQIPVRKK